MPSTTHIRRNSGIHGYVTPRIIQGSWPQRHYPGTSAFAANCYLLSQAFRNARYLERNEPIAELFRVVEARSHILQLSVDPFQIVPLLVRVGRMHEQWRRDIRAWRPQTDDADEQVPELIRHLFELYPTSEFFVNTWLPLPGRPRDWRGFAWYLHVAGGGNVRTAPGIPAKLTRRAAHEMLQAPPIATATEAIRWGQLRALGACGNIVWRMFDTAAAYDFDNDDVWLPLFAKIIDDTNFPINQVAPLVDYVHHRMNQAPVDRPFTVKGRPLDSLTRGMERWHVELGQEQRALYDLGANTWGDQEDLRTATWDPQPKISAMHRGKGERSWEIVELRSFSELLDEGAAMHHCIVSYAHECVDGSSSVWSMRCPGQETLANRVTVHVSTHNRYIAEARGFANAPISPSAFRRLSYWARENKLDLGRVPVQSN